MHASIFAMVHEQIAFSTYCVRHRILTPLQWTQSYLVQHKCTTQRHLRVNSPVSSFFNYVAMYPEITRPNVVTAIPVNCDILYIHHVHILLKNVTILSHGKGVKGF